MIDLFPNLAVLSGEIADPKLLTIIALVLDCKINEAEPQRLRKTRRSPSHDPRNYVRAFLKEDRTMKFNLFLLPTIPATYEERRRLRPIGRNNDKYQEMLTALRATATLAEDLGYDVLSLPSIIFIPKAMKCRSPR